MEKIPKTPIEKINSVENEKNSLTREEVLLKLNPEGRKIFEKIDFKIYGLEIGGASKEKIREDLLKIVNRGDGLSCWNGNYYILGSDDFKVLENKEHLDLIEFWLRDFGFSQPPTFEEICLKAKECGLELCPPETGPYLVLQYGDQVIPREDLFVAMEPILPTMPRGSAFGEHLSQNIFELARNDGEKKTLYLSSAQVKTTNEHSKYQTTRWKLNNQNKFIFKIPSQS